MIRRELPEGLGAQRGPAARLQWLLRRDAALCPDIEALLRDASIDGGGLTLPCSPDAAFLVIQRYKCAADFCGALGSPELSGGVLPLGGDLDATRFLRWVLTGLWDYRRESWLLQTAWSMQDFGGAGPLYPRDSGLN
ncbi:MAG: hypothetical protein EA353_03725 [Puniceicoccaceae bacterium]|nr:MAG: hypothetical protein EA353_03725 [Puniceicoccaceae bacterium]